jgi:hypothetical protein
MKLTDQAMPRSTDGKHTRWTDPETGQEFVLVPTEHFEKLQAIVDGIARRAGWDDPAMDVYEQFRKQK